MEINESGENEAQILEAMISRFNNEFHKLERNFEVLQEQNQKISRFMEQQKKIYKKPEINK